MKKFIAALLFISALLPVFAFSGCKRSSGYFPKYTINAVYTENKIEGTLEYEFKNPSDKPIDAIKFNLYANAYSEKAKNRPVPYGSELKNFGGTEISDCLFCGSPAEFSVTGEDGNVLEIKTAEIPPNGSAKVSLSFSTVIPAADLRLGDTGETVNLGDFFPVACKAENGEFIECEYSPVGDPYYSGCSDYDVTITVPSEYVAASSGSPVSSETKGAATVYRYSLKKGRDFALCLSKNFTVKSEQVGGITLNVYGDAEFSERALSAARSALRYFSSAFGKFPYETMSVVKTGFLQGGMEYSGLCFISDSAEGEKEELTVVHEIAHEWWHCGVGNDQINEAYIDEGLAEYSSYLYFAENGNAERAEEILNRATAAYKAYFDVGKILRGEANTVMNRPLSSFSGDYEYVAIAYAKPLIMFTEYEKTIGRNKAKRRLSALYKDNLYGEINSDALISALGYPEFFRSYIDGKVII
ncbi:MAG TPA: hypothetical protein DDW54_04470 [Clostridiales bacterium]|nr:hypothetical protein [Clostridiales bacterium]